MNFTLGNENLTIGVTQIAPVLGVLDDDPNNSDKTFIVPDGEMWKLIYANVTLFTSAAVGNRQIRLSVVNPDGYDVGYISAGATQAASLTRSYGFLQGIYRETSFIDGMIQTPIPMDLFLPAGSLLRFHDSAGISVAADDMTVAFSVQRFKGC